MIGDGDPLEWGRRLVDGRMLVHPPWGPTFVTDKHPVFRYHPSKGTLMDQTPKREPTSWPTVAIFAILCVTAVAITWLVTQ